MWRFSLHYYCNECLVYGLVLSLSIVESLSLSAFARSEAINSKGQNSWTIIIGKHVS